MRSKGQDPCQLSSLMLYKKTNEKRRTEISVPQAQKTEKTKG